MATEHESELEEGKGEEYASELTYLDSIVSL